MTSVSFSTPIGLGSAWPPQRSTTTSHRASRRPRRPSLDRRSCVPAPPAPRRTGGRRSLRRSSSPRAAWSDGTTGPPEGSSRETAYTGIGNPPPRPRRRSLLDHRGVDAASRGPLTVELTLSRRPEPRRASSTWKGRLASRSGGHRRSRAGWRCCRCWRRWWSTPAIRPKGPALHRPSMARRVDRATAELQQVVEALKQARRAAGPPTVVVRGEPGIGVPLPGRGPHPGGAARARRAAGPPRRPGSVRALRRHPPGDRAGAQ